MTRLATGVCVYIYTNMVNTCGYYNKNSADQAINAWLEIKITKTTVLVAVTTVNLITHRQARIEKVPPLTKKYAIDNRQQQVNEIEK